MSLPKVGFEEVNDRPYVGPDFWECRPPEASIAQDYLDRKLGLYLHFRHRTVGLEAEAGEFVAVIEALPVPGIGALDLNPFGMPRIIPLMLNAV